MSAITDLQTAVETTLEGIGMPAIHKGQPRSEPSNNVPHAVIKIHEPDEIERWTFGPSGTIAMRRDIDIWGVLGTKNMIPQQAEQAKLEYAQAMREAFCNFDVAGFTDIHLFTGLDNMDTYQEEGIAPQITYKLRALETPAADASSAEVPQLLDPFIARVLAAQARGWLHLGTLPTGLHFRESDIAYVAPYYYVFNTEGDGNPQVEGPTYTIATWSSNGTLATLTLSAAHGITVGATGFSVQVLGTGNPSLDGLLFTATAATSTTLTFASAVNSSGVGGTAVVFSWAVSSWTADGLTATIRLSTPHNIPIGTTIALVDFTGLTATSGSVGNLNGALQLCIAPTSTMLIAIAPLGSTNGAGGAAGTATKSGVNAQIGVRRALSLTGITAADGADYVSRTATMWYASVLVEGATWYLFGTKSAAVIGRAAFTGAWPSARDSFTPASPTTVTGIVGGDVHVRRNPVDNYWYAIVNGSPDGTTDLHKLHVYKSESDTDPTTGTWDLIGDMTTIFQTIGTPAWAAYAAFDASLAFVDGSVYAFFTGRPTDPEPNSVGVVKLNGTTYLAEGEAYLIETTDTIPDFASSMLSDLTHMDCPDGKERIFGFAGGSHDGTGHGSWGCLELN